VLIFQVVLSSVVAMFSRAGVGEIVGAVFSVIAIVALVIVLVYLLNMFSHVLTSSHNVEKEMYVFTHTVPTVSLVKCSGGYCVMSIEVAPEAIPYVRDVVCVGENSTELSSVVKCGLESREAYILNVEYSRASFRKYNTVVFSIVSQHGYVMYLSVSNMKVSISSMLTLTGRGREAVLVLDFYNNSTSWTCINATLWLVYSDGKYATEEPINVPLRCIKPLASYIFTKTITLKRGHGSIYLEGDYMVNLARTYHVRQLVAILTS